MDHHPLKFWALVLAILGFWVLLVVLHEARKSQQQKFVECLVMTEANIPLREAMPDCWEKSR